MGGLCNNFLILLAVIHFTITLVSLSFSLFGPASRIWAWAWLDLELDFCLNIHTYLYHLLSPTNSANQKEKIT